jgi:photosystem II stability/assembly factor-like uncharacterized protein
LVHLEKGRIPGQFPIKGIFNRGGIMRIRTLWLALSLAAFLSRQIPSQAQWIQTNGPYSGSINCFAVSDTNLFAGTYGGGVFLSTDNGTSWTEVNTGLTNPCILSFCMNGSNLFAGTDGGGVFLSTNNGTSWTEVGTGLTNISVYALASSGTNLFAGTLGGGVFHSTNSGANWTEVNTGLTNTEVRALAVSGTNLFAGTSGGGVFLSTNNGTSWTEVNTGLTNTDVRALAVCDTNLFAGTDGGGVFLSTNNGTSWTADNKGLTYLFVKAFTISGTNLFVSATALWGIRFGSGVFLLTENSTKWTEVSTGLTNISVYALAVSGTNLFAGTFFDGVWRRPLSEMIITSVEGPLADRRLPENFSLEQNYPNPFNPATTIAFHLPASSFVTLKVYNSDGQEVAFLVNGQLPAGNHRTGWNASGVPSGVYFYSIQAGTYSETKKLVVMR